MTAPQIFKNGTYNCGPVVFPIIVNFICRFFSSEETFVGGRPNIMWEHRCLLIITKSNSCFKRLCHDFVAHWITLICTHFKLDHYHTDI
jgi:hypothetical protein